MNMRKQATELSDKLCSLNRILSMANMVDIQRSQHLLKVIWLVQYCRPKKEREREVRRITSAFLCDIFPNCLENYKLLRQELVYKSLANFKMKLPLRRPCFISLFGK